MVAEILELDIIKDESDVLVILANFAVQLYYQSRKIWCSDNNLLVQFLSDEHFNEFRCLDQRPSWNVCD